MKLSGIGDYLHKLFGNDFFTAVALVAGAIGKFFFPESQYMYGALAVLGMMVLDLATKLYALKRQNGGYRKAVKDGKISSSSFFRGTADKLIVFGVMLIICGFAYRLSIISEVAVWFTQVVFILMFLRDVLSILENLRDAGIKGLGLFERLVKNKIKEYVPEDPTDTTETPSSSGDGSNTNNISG